ncbi:class I SAM-dependent methyltransferase [Anaerophaga thermohalophila]|jgi:SAM-dependent methyltransferase|uniref:class I SAM-dependent methyltransferase n=1 Tax=Anaerophaga thermohalophila TaxID=177400 RepID=UPI0002F04DD0|nr:class I SAM-dependent methyltransferase [Anaerophaga thermohalophila]
MPKTEPFDHHQTEYEQWFEDYEPVYLSELEAIRKVLPASGAGVEIGVGSGLFAAPLGIRNGCDPSSAMLKKAVERGIYGIEGTAENLPYRDATFDYALMVTTICFVDDPEKAVAEVYRILRNRGKFVIGFVDKDSPVGKKYQEYKSESTFYRDATFFSTDEICNLLKRNGFNVACTVETVFGGLNDVREAQEPREGHGEGSFVVVVGEKKG